VDRSLASVIERAKRDCPVPVCVGFGISGPDQAAEAVAAGAEGIIVGSWLVRAAGEGGDPAAAVGERVAALAGALRR
jgi:tryptophan synthase alpha chain